MFTLKLIGLKSSSGANESQMAELREELEEARGWKTKVRIWNGHVYIYTRKFSYIRMHYLLIYHDVKIL